MSLSKTFRSNNAPIYVSEIKVLIALVLIIAPRIIFVGSQEWTNLELEKYLAPQVLTAHIIRVSKANSVKSCVYNRRNING